MILPKKNKKDVCNDNIFKKF